MMIDKRKKAADKKI